MPLPENTKPIVRSSLRDEIYHTLLNWVIEGQLKPGEKILDLELAQSLGVSRTPVREALRRLEDKHFVSTVPGRCTRVHPVSHEEMTQIYPLLISLEQLAVRLGLDRLDAQVLDRMTLANAGLKSALECRDAKLATAMDMEFHRLMTDTAENSYLSEMLMDLKLRHRRFEIAFFRETDFSDTSVFEHEKIIQTLAERHLEKTVDLIRINWMMTLKRLELEGWPAGTGVMRTSPEKLHR